MFHRVFVAINLPEEIKEELINFQRKWQELPGKWVKKENLHITLVFLGNVKTEFLPKVFEAAKKTAISQNPFSLSLSKISFFPQKSFPPRMIWVFVEKSKELENLQKNLKKFLKEKNLPFLEEERDFSPHITLVRLRQWELKRMELEEIPQINEEISLSFLANSLEVMESKLKRGGAEYTVLESIPLANLHEYGHKFHK